MYAGKILEDEHTLSYYNFQKESVMHLIAKPFEIYVKLIGERSKTFTLRVNFYTTVEDIKAMIVDKHISPHPQTLVFNGITLQYEALIGDYHIENDSVLYLVLKHRESFDANLLMLSEIQKEQISIQVKLETEAKKQQEETKKFHEETEKLKEETEKLKKELSIERNKSEVLQQKCNYLESTIIASLLERLKGLEDTVERLWAISRDELALDYKILGTGGWGYVTEATYRGRTVAAKCLHEAIVSPHNQELFAKEMKISARCRHRNLVEFIGAVPDHPAIIVTELMDCTLRAALTNRRATPNHIHPISMDVAQGLLYLHNVQPHPLIHRDVSASNVLLKAAGNGWIAKLSDLGSSQFVNLAKTTAPGCPLYSAPEVRPESAACQQTVKIDVYSFGVLLIEMLTREMPTGSIEVLVTSVQSRWPHFVPLIISCTDTDPNQRPSMNQVIDQLDIITI